MVRLVSVAQARMVKRHEIKYENAKYVSVFFAHFRRSTLEVALFSEQYQLSILTAAQPSPLYSPARQQHAVNTINTCTNVLVLRLLHVEFVHTGRGYGSESPAVGGWYLVFRKFSEPSPIKSIL